MASEFYTNYYEKYCNIKSRMDDESMMRSQTASPNNYENLSDYESRFLQIEYFLFAFFDENLILIASTRKPLGYQLMEKNCFKAGVGELCGVLGPKQLRFFEPFTNNLIDITEYNVDPNLYSICNNGDHALFHSARINLFKNLTREFFGTLSRQVWEWKENRYRSLRQLFSLPVESHPNMWVRDAMFNMNDEELNVFAFIYIDDRLTISNIDDRTSMSLDLESGKTFLEYMTHHMLNCRHDPIFAVLNQFQEELFRRETGDKYNCIDISKYLIKELDHICLFVEDTEYHVRRIIRIQEFIKNVRSENLEMKTLLK